jgi:hypothetical protein
MGYDDESLPRKDAKKILQLVRQWYESCEYCANDADTKIG